MSNWRDRITPEQCDWDYLEERHGKAAHMAGVRVARTHEDPMCDADDFTQDALLYMAANRKTIDSIVHQSMLVRHLVSRVSENNRAAENKSEAVNRNLDVGEMDL